MTMEKPKEQPKCDFHNSYNCIFGGGENCLPNLIKDPMELWAALDNKKLRPQILEKWKKKN